MSFARKESNLLRKVWCPMTRFTTLAAMAAVGMFLALGTAQAG